LLYLNGLMVLGAPQAHCSARRESRGPTSPSRWSDVGLGPGAARPRHPSCLVPVPDPKADITNEPAIASDSFAAGRPICSRSAGSSFIAADEGQIGYHTNSI
jgi:hypothetical protein